jgi:Protein of unknown function (DUF992)
MRQFGPDTTRRETSGLVFDIDQRSKLRSMAVSPRVDKGAARALGGISKMTIRHAACLTSAAALIALATGPAPAQTNVKVGTLTCDVSAGVGMILTQKQTMTCSFAPASGEPVDLYTGRIDQFGVALGAVQQGVMVWGVLAPTSGVPHGALAGSYGGVGAQATIGAGLGANVLVGGTGRAFSLQPLSIQGQTGLNIAGGGTTVTLNSVQ